MRCVAGSVDRDVPEFGQGLQDEHSFGDMRMRKGKAIGLNVNDGVLAVEHHEEVNVHFTRPVSFTRLPADFGFNRLDGFQEALRMKVRRKFRGGVEKGGLVDDVHRLRFIYARNPQHTACSEVQEVDRCLQIREAISEVAAQAEVRQHRATSLPTLLVDPLEGRLDGFLRVR